MNTFLYFKSGAIYIQIFNICIMNRTNCSSKNSDNYKILSLVKSYNQMSINKDRFKESLALRAVQVPTAEVPKYLSALQDFLLNRPRISNIVDNESIETRLLLLSETIKDQIPSELKEKVGPREIVQYQLDLSYDSYSAFDILDEVLPVSLPRNYSIVGNVCYISLPGELYNSKATVGEVLLDKLDAESIVTIRNGKVEVLAGKDDIKISMTERDVTINADLTHCLWNSLMEFERDRLLEKFGRDSVVVDVFGGAGALAIRAAKKGSQVIVNDPSADCYNIICDNIKENKASQVYAYNLAPEDLLKKIAERPEKPTEEAAETGDSPTIESLQISDVTDIVLAHESANLELLPKICEMWEHKNALFHVYVTAENKDEAVKQLFRLQCCQITDASLVEFYAVKSVDSTFCISLRLIPDNEEIVSVSGDEPEDRREEMMRDMEFMKNSMNDQTIMSQSMLTSLIGSMIFDQGIPGLKRKSEDDKPS